MKPRNQSVGKNPVYVPADKILTTPKSHELLVSQFFEGVEPRVLKLKGNLLERTLKYIPELIKDFESPNIMRLAGDMLDGLGHIGFVKADHTKERIFHTAIKKGSLLVNISKYYYNIKHVKGISISYSSVTATEVLQDLLVHSVGRWDIEIDESISDEEANYYFELVKKASQNPEGRSNYEIMTDLIFSLSPYKFKLSA